MASVTFVSRGGLTSLIYYCKSSINPPGCLFISDKFRGGGGLNRDGGLVREAGLFNLEKAMVSVLHKELECKVDKVKYKKPPY